MSSDPERSDLLEHLGIEIRAYQNALDKADDAVADILGINRTDARCLDIVDQHGRITAGRLAEEAGLTTGAVTSVIDRLERVGLLHRIRDREDRRKVWIACTSGALEAIGTLYEPLIRSANRELERFSMQELLTVIEFLRTARAVTNDHNAMLRTNGDSKLDAKITKLRNKVAAKRRKRAATPDRLRTKLESKQAKLGAKISREP
jgi:DNA-binding MarR family transcriptional regulator